MWTSGIDHARDYNRGLPAPVRWGHMAAACIRPLARPFLDWAGAPGRRAWAPRLIIGLVLVFALLPFDGLVAHWVARHQLSGDARRELESLQQYGQGLSSLLVAAVIWLQDPARRRRLADWAAAYGLTWFAVFAVKT